MDIDIEEEEETLTRKPKKQKKDKMDTETEKKSVEKKSDTRALLVQSTIAKLKIQLHASVELSISTILETVNKDTNANLTSPELEIILAEMEKSGKIAMHDKDNVYF